ncbi:MAG: helix-turn-helix domain-containing protein [Clostridiales bacterium]|nr:helix-turn-helix domain-containing protein [Clostridiales bacterium]
MIDAKQTGRFIAQCRKEKSWTQKELGERLGVTDRAVSKWETGRSLPDISLLEPLCALFEISVSELLAGQKMGAVDYKKETDRLLMDAIGKNSLYGFQVVLYLLLVIGLFLMNFPLFLERVCLMPRNALVTGLCWGTSLVIYFIEIYLDKKLPLRQFRSSNVRLEGIASGLYFLFYMAIILSQNGRLFFIENRSTEDLLYIGTIVAIGFVMVVVVSVFAARRRRKEWNEWEHYK